MSNKNFWGMMNKGISVNNNYQNRVSSPKEKRESEIVNHQYKDSIGGDSSNYKNNER